MLIFKSAPETFSQQSLALIVESVSTELSPLEVAEHRNLVLLEEQATERS
jgi:hypothetical protein